MKIVMTEKAYTNVVDSFDAAYDAVTWVNKPLLMDGDGQFYYANGNRITNAEVVAEHRRLQTTIMNIKNKLDFAKSQIERVED